MWIAYLGRAVFEAEKLGRLSREIGDYYSDDLVPEVTALYWVNEFDHTLTASETARWQLREDAESWANFISDSARSEAAYENEVRSVYV